MLSGGLAAALAVGFVVAVVGLRGPVGEALPGGRGVGSGSAGPADPGDVTVELPGAQAGDAAAGRLEDARAGSGSLPGQHVDRAGAAVVRDAFAEVAAPTCDTGTDTDTDCFAWQASTAWWAAAPEPAYGQGTVLIVELATLADHRGTAGDTTSDDAGDVEVVRAGGLHLVSARDLATGELRWRARLTLHREPESVQVARPVVAGGLVLLLAEGHEVVALGRDDGRERWQHVRDGATRILDATSTSEQLLVALASDARAGDPELLLALDPTDGTERWAQPAGRAIVHGPVAAVVDRAGRVQGLDPSTGQVRWESAQRRAPPLALAVGPWVLIGDRGGLTLLDAADGALLERWAGPTVPVVWRDGSREVVLLVTGQVLHHLDAQGRRWATPLDDPCCLGAQVDEATVLVGLEDGTLLGLDRNDGRVLARREVALPAGVGGTHSVAAGHRFVAREEGEAIRVHDPRTGDLLARLPRDTLPLVVGHRVVLRADREVAVLEGATASELVAPGG